MIDFPYLKEIVQPNESKIILLVVDGLGGAPRPETSHSELETAAIPNLDRLARESACGLTIPVLPGITPGSGPGHLALFGYDPLKYTIGRGILEALGIGLELRPGDVAARGNFCTVDSQGKVTDRRAGRPSNEENQALCRALGSTSVDGVEVSVHPVKEHRFVVRLRGDGLSERVSETDPQKTGVEPVPPRPLQPSASKTAKAMSAFVQRAAVVLREEKRANMVLLRGFSQLPSLPSMGNAYGLRAAAIAAYPMYRGLAKVVGMEVLTTGNTFADEVETLRRHYPSHDFFYLHYKPADAAGEDGDFEAKVQALEALDTHIPDLLALKPDVFVVAGDHSTPSIVAGHSWHSVPVMVHSHWTHGEKVDRFCESACARGSIGQIQATHLMLLVLAHASRLTKFGP